MTDKVTKLIKGAVFGIVAGIFAVFALIYLLHSLRLGPVGAHRRRQRPVARLPDRRRS